MNFLCNEFRLSDRAMACPPPSNSCNCRNCGKCCNVALLIRAPCLRPCPGLPRIAATPRRSDIRYRPPSSRLSLFTPTGGTLFRTSDSCFVFLLALLTCSRLCNSRHQAPFLSSIIDTSPIPPPVPPTSSRHADR